MVKRKDTTLWYNLIRNKAGEAAGSGRGMETRMNNTKMEGESEVQEALEKTFSRGKVIVRTSVIGILANVLLAAFKAVVGLLSGSIAIVLDAVNNITDAGSSLVTIIGTRLAAKAPDRKHPFGHGRVEYLSAMIIAIIILYAGLASFTESVRNILKPSVPDYSPQGLVIVAAAVLVKIILGRYVKSVGESVHSDSLVNSGKDAMLDSVISATTLAAALIYITTGLSLEAWLAAVISVVIIKAGIDMLRDTISQLLGERADAELARGIRETVQTFPQVRGVYDLVLNNYGPDTFNGSLHVEVPDTCVASELDELLREITIKVLEKHNVLLTAIGVYSYNTKHDQAYQMETQIREMVLAHPGVIQMHGFYVNEEKKRIRFDVVISFDVKDRKAAYQKICQDVNRMYPEYELQIALDTDFSES